MSSATGPALHDVGGSLCRSFSSFKILFDAIRLLANHVHDYLQNNNFRELELVQGPDVQWQAYSEDRGDVVKAAKD